MCRGIGLSHTYIMLHCNNRVVATPIDLARAHLPGTAVGLAPAPSGSGSQPSHRPHWECKKDGSASLICSGETWFWSLGYKITGTVGPRRVRGLDEKVYQFHQHFQDGNFRNIGSWP
jgi:hypothetical protein